MPPEDAKILEFNQYQTCNNEPFAFYADLECSVQKTDRFFQCLQNRHLKA